MRRRRPRGAGRRRGSGTGRRHRLHVDAAVGDPPRGPRHQLRGQSGPDPLYPLGACRQWRDQCRSAQRAPVAGAGPAGGLPCAAQPARLLHGPQQRSRQHHPDRAGAAPAAGRGAGPSVSHGAGLRHRRRRGGSAARGRLVGAAGGGDRTAPAMDRSGRGAGGVRRDAPRRAQLLPQGVRGEGGDLPQGLGRRHTPTHPRRAPARAARQDD